ncbi:MAG: Ig-like domain-containing protein [Gallionellaceae bacterium]
MSSSPGNSVKSVNLPPVLHNGQRVFQLKLGALNTFKATLGSHYRVLQNEEKDELRDGVVAKRIDNDLQLTYSDATVVQLQDFFVEGNRDHYDITLPADQGSYLINSESTLETSLNNGGQFAYESENTLATQSTFAAQLSSPATVSSNTHSFNLFDAFTYGGIAVAAGGGIILASGSGSASAAPTASTSPTVKNTVSGVIVAGPVIENNGLIVSLYDAEGKILLGSSALDAQGFYSVDIGDYSGALIAKLLDENPNPDFIDEATGLPKDISANLMAMSGITSNATTVNLNALTTLAALKAGVNYAAPQTTPLTVQEIEQVNSIVANAFGLSDLVGGAITTTVNSNGESNSNFNTGTLTQDVKYGAILAALSGMDALNAGDNNPMQATIDYLANEFEISYTQGQGAGAFNLAAMDAMVNGAGVAALTNSGEGQSSLTALVSNQLSQVSASVSIDAITPDNIINAQEQGIAITGATVAGANVVLTMGGTSHTATVTETTWSYILTAADLSAMGQGGETIQATATLSGGVTAGATRSIVIDTLVPVASSAPILEGGKTPSLTNTFTPTLSGVSEVGSQIKLYVNDSQNTLVGKAVPDANGKWSILTSSLGEGAHTLSVQLVDAAGNENLIGGEITFRIDTLAPAAPVINSITSDDIISAGEQAVAISGSAEANATIALSLGSNVRSITADASGNWSYSLLAADISSMGQGGVTLNAVATDLAGNSSTTGTRGINVDTLPPAPPASVILPNAADAMASEAVNGAFTVNAELGSVVTVTFTNGTNTIEQTFIATGAPIEVSLTTIDLITLGDGTISVSATATDAVGNVSQAGSSSFVLDTLAPDMPVINVVENNNVISKLSGASFVSGSAEANATVALSLGGHTYNLTADAQGNWRYLLLAADISSMGEGAETLSAIATDLAGNISLSATREISVNTSSPTITVTGVSLSADTGIAANDFLTNATNQTISGTLNSALTTGEKLYGSVDNGTTWTDITSKVIGTAINWTGATLAGSSNILFKMMNAFGNNSLATGGNGYVLDTVAPTLTISSDLSAIKAGQTATINFTFSENPGSTFTSADIVSNGGTLTGLAVDAQNPLVYTATFTPTVNLTSGLASVTLMSASYTDAAGNNGGTANSLSLSVDTLAPEPLSFVPVDGTNILPGGNLALSFSENIAKGTGNIRLVNDSDNTSATIAIASNEISLSGSTLTLNPATDLLSGKAYHVEIDTGAITDLAGNVWAGINDAAQWNFIASTPAISLDTIALDNRVNAIEGMQTIALRGLVSSNDAAVLADFLTTDFTVTLTPQGGGPAINVGVNAFNKQTGEWAGSIAANALSDGKIYDVAVSVLGTTGAANGAAAATRGQVTVDQSAPGTPVMNRVAGDDVINASEINSVISGSNESGTIVELRFGGTIHAALVNGTNWSYTLTAADLTAMGQGNESLIATASDMAGNKSGPVTRLISIDTLVPDAPGIALTTDTGHSASDKQTSNSSLTVTRSESMTTVQYSTDNSSWSNNFNAVEGSNTVYVRQTDLAGNISMVSNPYTFTFDSTLPVTPTIALSTDTGISALDKISKNALLNLSGIEASATVQYSTNNSTWTSSFTAAEGSNTVYVRQTDVAGNVSAVGNAYTFTLDTLAPTTEVKAKPIAAVQLYPTGMINGQYNDSVQIVAVGSNGDYVVTWSGIDTGNDRGIFVQKFNANGTAAGSQAMLEATGITNNSDQYPQISSIGNSGAYVVVWDGRGTTSTSSIFIQLFNADGTTNGSATKLDGVRNPYGNADDERPQITALGTGGEYVVTYHSWFWTGGGWDTAIMVQKFDAAGVAVGSAVMLDGYVPSGGNGFPQVSAVGSAGDYVVAWQGGDSGGDETIFVQKFNANGTVNGSMVSLEATGATNGNDNNVQLVGVGSAGEYVVTWQGIDSAGDQSIFVQHFNVDGTVKGSSVQLEAIGNSTGIDQAPQIAAVGSSGAYVVTWAGADSTGDPSIFVQRFSADGSLNGSATQLEATGVTNRDDNYAQISALGTSGEYAVTWAGIGTNNSWNIYVQRFNTDGSLKGNAVLLEGVAGNTDTLPQIAAVGNSGAFAVTWQGYNSSGYPNIYVQKFNADGSLNTDITLSADSGLSGNDFITNIAAQTISAPLSAALVTGETLHGSVDGGGTWTDITSMVNGTSVTWTGVTLAGSNSIQFKVMDAAGNAGPIYTKSYVLDTVAPTQTISTVDISANTGSSSADFLTNISSQTITGTLSANLAAGDKLFGSLDNGTTWTDISSKVSGTAINWAGVTLLGGNNSIVFKITDAAGNAGAITGSQIYVLDTVAPTQTVSSVGISTDTGSSTTDFITKIASQTITGTLSTALASGEVLYGSTNNGTTWTDIGSKVTGTAINWTNATLSGTNGTIVFKVTDAAGNSGSSSGTQTYVLDTVSPIAPAVALASDTGSSTTDKITSNAALTVTGTEANATVQYSTDSSTWTNNFTAVEGNNTVYVRQADVAGNTSSASSAYTFTKDTSAPTVTITDDAAGSASGAVTYTYTFSEAVTGFDATDVLISSGTKGSFTSIDSSHYTLMVTPPSDSGTITMDIAAGAATDTAGNTSTAATQSSQAYAPPQAGDAVINLGSSGKLIAPVQVEGKWYYYWDLSGDGTVNNSGNLNGGTDVVNHAFLNTLFNQNVSGGVNPNSTTAGTTDIYRYGTINGIKVALPTYGYTVDANGYANAGFNNYATGTSIADGTSTNPTYNDVLAIWDAYNGSTTAGNIAGIVPAWNNIRVWSSTPVNGAGSLAAHAAIDTQNGYVYYNTDDQSYLRNVIVEVLPLDTTAPTLAITSNVSAVKSGEIATITFTFSEATSNFVAGDVVTTGGTLSNFSAVSGTVYTATFTPTASLASGNASITVASASYTDAAGNNGGAGATPAISIDTLAPTTQVQSMPIAAAQLYPNGLMNGQNNDSVQIAAVGTNGDYAVVWSGIDSSLTDRSIFVQKFNANGTTAGSQVMLEATGITNNTDQNPQISAIGTSGAFAVSWEGRGTTSTSSIFIQHFNADGSTNGIATKLDGVAVGAKSGIANNDDQLPQITAVGTTGEYIATYYSWFWMGGGWDTQIMVQKFNADGTVSGSAVALEGASANWGNDRQPQVATVGSNGDYVVTWQGADVNNDQSICVQKFNANGTINGSMVLLDAIGVVTGDDNNSQIVGVGSAGEYVVTWQGIDSAGDNSIFVQHFNVDGTVKGSSVQLEATGNSTGIDQAPQIAAVGSSGAYVVTWSGADSAGDLSIYVQRFNADGSVNGSATLLEATGVTNRDDNYAQITALGTSGEYAVTWAGIGTNNSWNIYVQRFNTDGSLKGNAVLLEGYTGNTDLSPQITALGNSGAFAVTWQGNNSSGYPNIYVQKFNADGSLNTDVTLSADSGLSGNDFITNTAAQTISAPLSAALVSGETLHGSVDGGVTWTDITSKVSGTSVTWTGVTLAGSSNIQFKVMDAAGNAGPIYSKAYVLDTVAPTQTVSAVHFGADTGTSSTDFLTNTASQTITGTLSATLATGDTLYGSTNNGTTWIDITSKVAGTAITWTGATLSNSSNILFKISDTAGNVSVTTGNQAYVLDSVAPTITITDDTAGSARGAVTYTYTFSEAVTGFDATDVTISGGNKGTFTTVDSSHYTLVVTPPATGNGTITMNVAAGAASDAAGNTSTVATPNSQAYAQPQAGDSVIDLGAGYGKLIAPIQVEGNWFYFWDRSGDGTSAGADSTNQDTLASIFNHDINGVTNTTVTNINGVYGITETYRYATINGIQLALPTLGGQSSPPFGVNGINQNQPGTAVSLNTTTDNPTYNDLLAIWDATNGSGTVASTTAAPIAGVPSGWLSSHYLSATPHFGNHAVLQFNDGNCWTPQENGFASVALQVFPPDTTAPTVAITSNLSTVKAGQTATITFTFSEVPTGFAAGDITTTNGTLSGLAVDANNTKVYTATFTPTANMASGNSSITVVANSYTDAAGNNGVAGTTPTINIDTVAPTVTITDDTAGSAKGAVTYTFTFSEAVTGFDATDVTISAGTKGTFTTLDSSHYTLVVTPPVTASGTLTVDVAVGAASDAAGNLSTVATQSSQAYVPAPVAGDAVIDLGSNGKLIAPVQVEGNWFYYWDRSGDGTSADTGALNGGADYTTHDILDGIFNKDINGVINSTVANSDGLYGTTDTYRYATLGGVNLALPTAGGQSSPPYGVNGIVAFQPGTALSLNTTAINPTYNDLLAIWDSYNGTGTTTGVITTGLPSGWQGINYHSATPTDTGHAVVNLTNGSVNKVAENYNNDRVAVQVLFPDITAPTVSSISITSATGIQASTLNAGDVVRATVTLSESTLVTGTPQLALNIGGTTVQASYVSGSGTTALVFDYTILANQTDANGMSVDANSLTLNGGTLKDAAGNSATLTHSLVSDNAGYLVDTAAPTLTITDNQAGTTTGAITYTFTFSEAVTGFDATDVSISAGTKGTFTTTDSSHYTLVVTPPTTASGTLTVDVAAGVASDAAGNLSTIATQNSQAYAPAPTAGQSVIDLGGTYGKLIAPAQVEGNWYYFWDLNGNGTSTDDYSLAVPRDLFKHDFLDGIFNKDINGVVGGGGNTTDTYRYGTINGINLALPTAGGPSGFSYGANGLGQQQPGTVVSLNTTTDNPTYNDLLAIWDAYNGTGTATTNNGIPTGWLGDGYWSATPTSNGNHAYVNLNGSLVRNDSNDTNGNLFVAVQVLFPDTTAPTVAITSNLSTVKAGQAVTITFTFSEVPTGFVAGDITVSNGTLSGLTVDVNNAKVYTAIFTPTTNLASGNAGITVAAGSYTDAAGNNGVAGTTPNVSIDTVLPAAITVALTADTGSSTTDKITSNAALTVTGTEANATVQYSTDSSTWTNNFTTVEGNNTVYVRQADVAGNTSSASSAYTYTKDTSAPTVTITDDTAGSAKGAVTYTYTFSEAVTGFDATDVTISAGSKGTFTATDSSHYTLVVTPPSGSGTITMDIVAGAAMDTAGNTSSAATQSSQAYAPPQAGDAVIDLGATYGKLIKPVNVDGNWFYFWDRSGNGVADGGMVIDTATHDQLDALFTQDINGVTGGGGNTTDTYRYATLNGIQLALPTLGWTGINASPSNTAIGNTATPTQGDTAINSTYNDLASIWDAFNANNDGTPSGWINDEYWSATAGGAGHLHFHMINGWTTDRGDTASRFVVLQVLPPDTTAPTVSSIALTSATGILNSTLNAGDVVRATVTMSEATSVTTTGGTPTLSLNIGGTTVQASYVSGSGTTALVFDYAILANQTDANGISIAANSLTLNGGTLKDAAGNAATLTHALVADNAGYLVDTVAPTVTVTDNQAGSASGAITYTFAFSEAVTGFDATDVTISAGTKGTFTAVSSSQYTLVVTPPSGSGTITANVAAGAATDTSGNLSTVATQNSQAYATTPRAGDTVIDLGASGKLIAPVQVEGKWYYYWDISGDGTTAGTDAVNHVSLNSAFNQDVSGSINPNAGSSGTTDVYRYGTINSIQVALPTYGYTVDANGKANPNPSFSLYANGTAVADGATTNATYNDVLAVWDAYNGSSTAGNISGIVPAWGIIRVWSSTPVTNGHVAVDMNNGYVYPNDGDVEIRNVILQVLPTADVVSSVSITSASGAQANTLNIGDVLHATVTMSEATTITGTPQLALNIGGTTVQANYASGSGTSALVFDYTILANQLDINGISIDANSLALNGGTLKDAAGNTATMTHALVSDNVNFMVATTSKIDLTGSGNNTIKLTLADVIDIGGNNIYNTSNGWSNIATGMADQMAITGNAGDVVQLVGGASWTSAGTATETASGHVFNVYNSTSTGQLLIDQLLTYQAV